jgi:hypothetical protein
LPLENDFDFAKFVLATNGSCICLLMLKNQEGKNKQPIWCEPEDIKEKAGQTIKSKEWTLGIGPY